MTLQEDLQERGALFARPDAHLSPFVSGYHVYLSGGTADAPETNWFFPAWPNIRFATRAGPWTIAVGREPDAPVPPCSLFGPTAFATRSLAAGGTLFGAGITPLGFSRLFGISAGRVANCVGDLTLYWPEAARLHTELQAAETLEEVKQLFDIFLTARLRPPAPAEENRIRRLHTLLVSHHGIGVAEVAAHLGVPPRSLHRTSMNAFGFPPKLLLRRSRFLKSFTAMLSEPDVSWPRLIDATYHDQSHFIRDSNDFLTMPPARFAALTTPLMRQSLMNRDAMLGAPVQALHAG